MRCLPPILIPIVLGLLAWLPASALAQQKNRKKPMPLRAQTGVQAAAAMLFEITDPASAPRLVLDDTGHLTIFGTIESTTGGFKFPDGTTQTTAATGTGGLWNTAGADLFYSAGSVGIGTSSPAARLDVSAIGTEPSIVTRGGADYATADGQYISIGHWDGATFTERIGISAAGEVGFGQVFTDVAFNVRNIGSDPFAFNVEKADGANLLTVLDDGSVGIGTVSTNVALNVRNVGSDPFAFNVERADGADFLTVQDDGTLTAAGPLTVSNLIESTTGGFKFPDGTTQTTAATGTGGLWNTAGNDLFYSAGSVGIGTSSPAARLDVSAIGTEPSIVTRNGVDYATADGQYISIGHWDGATFTERIGISAAGHVGIGHVISTVAFNVRNIGSEPLAFRVERADGTDLLTIQDDGIVGVGDRKNGVKFNVENVESWPDAFNVERADGTDLLTVQDNGDVGIAGTMGIGHVNSTVALNVRNIGSDPFAFNVERADGSNLLAVLDDGSVGVGRESANVALNVRNIGSDPFAFNVERADGTDLFTVQDDGTISFANGSALSKDGDLYFGSGAAYTLLDHPLAPAEMQLRFTPIEAPDRYTVYTGTVVLDASGAATVTLPAWYEVSTTDVHYQLTPMGAPGPNLYVAREVQNNRFEIAGGTAGMKVSWHLTATRADAAARARPFAVETRKAAEDQGRYYTPEAFGQPASLRIGPRDTEGDGTRPFDK